MMRQPLAKMLMTKVRLNPKLGSPPPTSSLLVRSKFASILLTGRVKINHGAPMKVPIV